MEKSDKETKTPSALALRGKHDINLALRPFFVLQRKCTSRRRVRRFRIGDMEATLEVKALERLPWFRDVETLMALITVAHHQVETGPKVFISPYAVLGMMGKRQHSGRSYDFLHRSLDRLLSVSVKGDFKFRKEHEWTRVTEWTHLLDGAYLAYATDEQTREVKGQRCWVRFSPLLWRDIAEGNLWTFDWERYRALEGSDLVKALYIHIQAVPRPEWEEDIFQVAAACGLIQYKYPSQVRRLLEPALEKLVEQGILTDCQWVTRGPFHRIRFSKPTPSALTEGDAGVPTEGGAPGNRLQTKSKAEKSAPELVCEYFADKWGRELPKTKGLKAVWIKRFARPLLMEFDGDLTAVKKAIDAYFAGTRGAFRRENLSAPWNATAAIAALRGCEPSRQREQRRRRLPLYARGKKWVWRNGAWEDKDGNRCATEEEIYRGGLDRGGANEKDKGDAGVTTSVGQVPAHKLWRRVLAELKLQMSKGTFDTWLRNTTLISYKDGTFVIGVPSAYAKDWLENRLLSTIQRTLVDIVGNDVGVEFEVNSEGGK